LTISTDSGKRYTTQKVAHIGAGYGAQDTVPIAAVTAGLDGNTDAHSITNIENGGNDLKVDSPQATTGGADARTATIIQQSDLDGPKDAYSKDAIPQVTDQLSSKAQGKKLILVGKGVQAAVTADHKVGEEVNGFTVTIKVSGDGVAFDDKAVKAMLKAALQRKVPQGSQLTTETITLNYDAVDATVGGGGSRDAQGAGRASRNRSDRDRAAAHDGGPAGSRRASGPGFRFEGRTGDRAPGSILGRTVDNCGRRAIPDRPGQTAEQAAARS